MSNILNTAGHGGVMSYEEKRTWVYLVACGAAYVVYLAIVLGRVGQAPVTHVSYVAVLLWTIGASIAVSIVGRILVETAKPSNARRSDVRDREIYRFGEYASRWFIVHRAGAATFMVLARWDHFCLAKVLFL